MHRWHENLTATDRVNLVAETEDGIAGCACLIGKVFDAIAVVPQQWGRGLADIICAEVFSRAQRNGCDRLELWVLEKNVRAAVSMSEEAGSPTADHGPLAFPPDPLLVGYWLPGLTTAERRDAIQRWHLGSRDFRQSACQSTQAYDKDGEPPPRPKAVLKTSAAHCGLRGRQRPTLFKGGARGSGSSPSSRRRLRR